MKTKPDTCPACGIKWIKHPGCIGTCAKLQIALRTLEQIASLPRGGRAKRNAIATLVFLDYT